MTGTTTPQMSDYHRRYLHALLGEYGARGDARFPVLSGILRREVTSTNELTDDDAATCIVSLRFELSTRPGPSPEDPF